MGPAETSTINSREEGIVEPLNPSQEFRDGSYEHKGIQGRAVPLQGSGANCSKWDYRSQHALA